MAELADALEAVLQSHRNPQGRLLENLARRLAPWNAVRFEALAHALKDSPVLSSAVRSDIQAALAALPADDFDRTRALDACLSAARDDCRASVRRLLGAESAAAVELDKFAIDEQHPLGGMRGGLTALAGSLRYGTYADHDGGSAPVLEAMVRTIAAGFQADAAPLADALRALARDFVTAASEATRRAAFEALKRLLTAAGASENFTDLAVCMNPGDVDASSPEALAQACRSFVDDVAQGRHEALLAGALHHNIADPASLSMVSALAQGWGVASAASLAATYLKALACNDFYLAALSADKANSNHPLSLSETTAYPEASRILQAACALRDNPTSARLLAFLGACSAADATQVRQAIDATVNARCSARPALEPQQRRALQSAGDLLAEQFDALRGHAEALFYGAHALYALERQFSDPTDISIESPANRDFVRMLDALPESQKNACLALMRDGIRGQEHSAATGAALASLTVTAAHLGRDEVISAFGATADMNVARALRFCASQLTPGSPYDTTSNTQILAERFREAARRTALCKTIENARKEPLTTAQNLQQMLVEQALARLALGPEQLTAVKHGLDVSAQEVAGNVGTMQGQTAGMALLALSELLVQSLDDLDSETIARFTGRYVDVKPDDTYDLTRSDLIEGLRRAAQTPLCARETALFLSALSAHEAARGRPAGLEDLIALAAPSAPEATLLMTLSDDERDELATRHSLDRIDFESSAAAIRSAADWQLRHDGGCLRLKPVLPDEAAPGRAADLVTTLAKSAVSDTLDARHARRAQGDYAVQAAGRIAEQMRRTGKIPASQKRELMAALSPGRFNLGRYVLLAKMHHSADAGKSSAAAEFERAVHKLGLSDASLLAHLRKGLLTQMGSLSRTALSAQGGTAAQMLSQVVSEAADPQSRLVLLTAGHCALERVAECLGVSGNSLVASMFEREWSRSFAPQDVPNAGGNPAVGALLEAKTAKGEATVSFAELMKAAMTEFLPESVASGYVDALAAAHSRLGRLTVTELIARNRILRTAKYLEGLEADIRAALAGRADFAQLRDSRAIAWHERQRHAYAECLTTMPPGSSVAVDKKGNFQILNFGSGLARSRQNGATELGCSLKAQASLSVELSEAVLFTKNADGSVEVAVSKGLEASAQAGLEAQGAVSGSYERQSKELSAEAGVGFSAEIGVGANYRFTVQNRLDVPACAVFMDRLVSGGIQARDLNAATVSHAAGLRAHVAVDISAGAALGFEIQEDSKPDSVTKKTLDDGSVVTESVGKSGGGVTIETTTERPDGTVEKQIREKGLASPLTDDPLEWTSQLETTAQVNAGLNGQVQAVRTVSTTPTVRAVSYEFSGRLTLSAGVSLTQAGVASVGEMLGEELEVDKSACGVWSIQTRYSTVENLLGNRTTGAVRRTSCMFDDNATARANSRQLSALLRAERVPGAAAQAIAALVAHSDLEPVGVSFEGHFADDARLNDARAGVLSLHELTRADKYAADTVVLHFEEADDATGLLSRVLNQTGKVVNDAFRFTTTTRRGVDVEIDVDALGRVTPQALIAGLARPQRLSAVDAAAIRV